jgi:hypothetical protein
MSNLIEHLERHLGEMEGGWSKDGSGNLLPFQVAMFPGGPGPGTSTYCTIGLSNHALVSPRSGKAIKHEIVLAARKAFGYKNIPALLQQVAGEALARRCPYLRGDLVGPRGPLFPGSRLEALYIACPAYFPDSFATFDLPDGKPG